MLTPREAFRYGFLLRTAEEGLTPEETQLRMQKAAATLLENVLGMAGKAGLLGVLGTGLAGAGAGYGLAKMQEGDVSAEDYQRQELIDAYRDASARLRQRTALRKTYLTPPPPPRLLQGPRK